MADAFAMIKPSSSKSRQMGIKDQISDARFLAQDGRYLGALSMLLLAVAASSRRAFPAQSARSFSSPKNLMGSGEAFKLFLGGRLNSVMFGGGQIDKPGGSALSIGTREGQFGLDELLYRYYRNGLIHQGEVPSEVEFVQSGTQGGLTISTRNKLSLDLGLLPILIAVVEGADCNAELYGREVFDVRPKATLDEERFKADLVSEFDISVGRYDVLQNVLFFLEPAVISAADDAELAKLFLGVVHTPQARLNGGAVAGLASRGLSDYDGNLCPKGIAVLRRIAQNYDRVRVG